MSSEIRILRDTNQNAAYRWVAIRGRQVLAEADTQDHLIEILVRVLVVE